jgi:hypothetical protein
VTVVIRPIDAPELVDKLEAALETLVGKIGEPEELLEALYLTAALRLVVKKP